MNHAMIDIETLDTRPSAVVLTVGVVVFGNDYREHRAFEVALPIAAQLMKGRTIDSETLNWWNDQPDPTQQQTFRTPSTRAFSDLNALFRSVEYTVSGGIWADSPSFDLVILENLFRDFDIDCPWTYKQHRDLRTLRKLTGYNDDDLEFSGVKHVALHDARHQVRVLRWCMRGLGTVLA